VNTVLRLLGILQDGNDLADSAPLSSAQPLEFTRAETVRIDLRVLGRAGNPIDLTGCTVRLICSRSSQWVGDGFVLNATVDAGAYGTASFALVPQTTRSLTPGRYVYAVWVIGPAPSVEQVCIVPLSALVLAPSTYPSA
jgi:hypothetical protein